MVQAMRRLAQIASATRPRRAVKSSRNAPAPPPSWRSAPARPSRRSRFSSTISSGARARKSALPSLASISGDLLALLGDLLAEARALGGDVDDARQRNRRQRAAHEHLRRAGGRGIGKLDLGDARQPLDRLAPVADVGDDRRARGDERQRHLRPGRHAHLRAHRANLGDRDRPASRSPPRPRRRRRNSVSGHGPSASSCARGGPSSPLIAQSSSVRNGMNGCSSA